MSKKRDKPVNVFFVDRCVGNSVVLALREAGFEAHWADELFTNDTPDDVWIARVGAERWLALTCDRRLSRSRGQGAYIQAIISAQARVSRYPNGTLGGEQMIDIAVRSAQRMIGFASRTSAPFVASLQSTGRINRIYP